MSKFKVIKTWGQNTRKQGLEQVLEDNIFNINYARKTLINEALKEDNIIPTKHGVKDTDTGEEFELSDYSFDCIYYTLEILEY